MKADKIVAIIILTAIGLVGYHSYSNYRTSQQIATEQALREKELNDRILAAEQTQAIIDNQNAIAEQQEDNAYWHHQGIY